MTAEDDLAADVRAALVGTGTIREVRMFGGVGFMLEGNMVAAVSRRGLLLRVGTDRYREALARPGARSVEMQGREMRGYVRVDPSVLSKAALTTWLQEASAFVLTLPPKPPKPGGTKPKQKGKWK